MSDDLQRDINRAKSAELLLQNELLTEAFQSLEHDYLKAWRETAARDTDARERLWQAVQIVGKIKDHIGTVLNDGKLAAAQLKELAEGAERKIRFFGR